MINRGSELTRYIINGLVATMFHYGTLTYLVETASIKSVSTANVLAAMVGILSSFTGNRFFVFKTKATPNNKILLIKFIILYTNIAFIHWITLLIWSDWLQWNYSTGFLLASFIQFMSSYAGNKILVFNYEN